MRAAIYTRVSTDDQVEGTSLETQRERCEAWIGERGWEVADVYVDGGESGAREQRPALARMLDAARAGRVEVVVVWKLDRLGRSVRHLENLLGELEEHDVAFASVGEGLDYSTPAGRAMRQVQAVFAEMERSLILERTTAGLRARARAACWPGGPPPFGFLLVREDGRTRLQLDGAEAEVLRRAAALIVDEGHTTWTAARVLNGLGLAPRNAERWVHNRLRKVLLSPTLGGEWTYRSNDGDIQVAIPPVLDPERYAALRDALGATIAAPRDPAGERFYLLSRGRLLGMCGAPYHGAWRVERKSRSYRCNGSRPEADPRCLDHNVNADMVEEVVWAEVVALLSEPERLTQMAEDYLGLQDAQAGAQTDNLATLDAKLAALQEARTERVAQALKAGVDASVLSAAVAEIEAEERALLAHRARLQEWREESVAGSARARRLQELAETARERLGSMAPHERRAVLDLLDVRVTVTGWTECEACEGRGRVKGGTGGHSCPTCRALRRVPSFRIEGVVLDSLDIAAGGRSAPTPPDSAIPFRLELAAG